MGIATSAIGDRTSEIEAMYDVDLESNPEGRQKMLDELDEFIGRWDKRLIEMADDSDEGKPDPHDWGWTSSGNGGWYDEHGERVE